MKQFYNSITKLQEGNAFRGLCLSVRERSHVTIAHDALDITMQGPPRTCSNFLNLGLTAQGPQAPAHPLPRAYSNLLPPVNEVA